MSRKGPAVIDVSLLFALYLFISIKMIGLEFSRLLGEVSPH